MWFNKPFFPGTRRRYIVRNSGRLNSTTITHTEESIENQSGAENEDNNQNKTNEAVSVENGESSTAPPARPKREKFDSGVVEDMDNGKGLSSSEDSEDEPVVNHQEASSDLASDMDLETSSDSEAPKFVDEGVEEDLKKSSKRQQEEDEPSYSSVMKEKIQALPLPPLLKDYLNYYREF